MIFADSAVLSITTTGNVQRLLDCRIDNPNDLVQTHSVRSCTARWLCFPTARHVSMGSSLVPKTAREWSGHLGVLDGLLQFLLLVLQGLLALAHCCRLLLRNTPPPSAPQSRLTVCERAGQVFKLYKPAGMNRGASSLCEAVAWHCPSHHVPHAATATCHL